MYLLRHKDTKEYLQAVKNNTVVNNKDIQKARLYRRKEDATQSKKSLGDAGNYYERVELVVTVN